MNKKFNIFKIKLWHILSKNTTRCRFGLFQLLAVVAAYNYPPLLSKLEFFFKLWGMDVAKIFPRSGREQVLMI